MFFKKVRQMVRMATLERVSQSLRIVSNEEDSDMEYIVETFEKEEGGNRV